MYKGRCYKVYSHNIMVCFIYYDTVEYDSYSLYHVVHGYNNTNNGSHFMDRFFDNKNVSIYTYQEITLEELMVFFPDTDSKKIIYLRKKKIKSLLIE